MLLTTDTARIEDKPRRAYYGDGWHGPPLREILRGVTSATAVARHAGLAQSLSALRGEPGRLDASSPGRYSGRSDRSEQRCLHGRRPFPCNRTAFAIDSYS